MVAIFEIEGGMYGIEAEPYVEPTESVNPTLERFKKSLEDSPHALPEDSKKVLLEYLNTLEKMQPPSKGPPVNSRITVSREELEEMKLTIGSMIFIAYGPYRPTIVAHFEGPPPPDLRPYPSTQEAM